MATITTRNGVDVDRLVATVGAIQADPGIAKFTFRARSSWEGGGRNKGEIHEFVHAGATTSAAQPSAAANTLAIEIALGATRRRASAAAQALAQLELRVLRGRLSEPGVVTGGRYGPARPMQSWPRSAGRRSEAASGLEQDARCQSERQQLLATAHAELAGLRQLEAPEQFGQRVFRSRAPVHGFDHVAGE